MPIDSPSIENIRHHDEWEPSVEPRTFPELGERHHEIDEGKVVDLIERLHGPLSDIEPATALDLEKLTTSIGELNPRGLVIELIAHAKIEKGDFSGAVLTSQQLNALIDTEEDGWGLEQYLGTQARIGKAVYEAGDNPFGLGYARDAVDRIINEDFTTPELPMRSLTHGNKNKWAIWMYALSGVEEDADRAFRVIDRATHTPKREHFIALAYAGPERYEPAYMRALESSLEAARKSNLEPLATMYRLSGDEEIWHTAELHIDVHSEHHFTDILRRDQFVAPLVAAAYDRSDKGRALYLIREKIKDPDAQSMLLKNPYDDLKPKTSDW